MNVITYMANLAGSDPTCKLLDRTTKSTAGVDVSEIGAPGERPESTASIQQMSLSNIYEAYSVGFDSLPDLSEDCQSSGSVFSIGDKLANSTFRTFELHDSTQLEKEERDTTLIDQFQMESRSSHGTCMYSSYTTGGNTQHDVCWNMIRPLDICSRKDAVLPPIPARNPRRLLNSARRDSLKRYSEMKRRSRNIRNIHLDLSNITADRVEENLHNEISSHRQLDCGLLNRTKGEAPVAKPSLLQSSWLSSDIREAADAKGTNSTAQRAAAKRRDLDSQLLERTS